VIKRIYLQSLSIVDRWQSLFTCDDEPIVMYDNEEEDNKRDDKEKTREQFAFQTI